LERHIHEPTGIAARKKEGSVSGLPLQLGTERHQEAHTGDEVAISGWRRGLHGRLESGGQKIG